MLTQKDMFYQSHSRIAEIYKTFSHLVQTGLTREELVRLIAMRPSLWARFDSWLDRLPSKGGN